jgi:hypothetical protein
MFNAGNHTALQNAIKYNGLRSKLLNIVIPSRGWVALGVVRIGFEVATSYLTLLVTVQPGSVTFEKAKALIVEMKNLCISLVQ